MESPTIRASRIVALSLAVGVFFTSQTVGMALASGRPIRFEWDVVQELLFWVLWASLAPAILALARRWPLDARPVYRPVMNHAVVAILLASLQTFVAFALHFFVLFLAGEVPGSAAAMWMMRQRPSLVWGVFMGVPFYWA